MFIRFLFLVCVVFKVVSAIPPGPRHIKGVQIQNTGNERLLIEMTNEDNFILPPGQMASIILEDTWSGKILARSEECQFKKCNAPCTVAELRFGGETKEDKYRVSVIEGYNKAIKIQPTSPSNFCKSSFCSVNIQQDCPKLYQLNDEHDNVIACNAIPEIFKKLCPQAAVNTEIEMLSCKTSDTYHISIG